MTDSPLDPPSGQSPQPSGLPAQPADHATPTPDWKSWRLAATAAVAFVLVGGAIIMSRSSSPAVVSPPVVSPAKPEVREPRVAAHSAGSSRTPKWIRTKQSGWATDGSRTISFELEAENDVGVWMKRVRPILAVRCLARETEVFVVTDSAASVEGIADRHTVHISFNEQNANDEQWLDSADHRELFAPDAAALVRQIARADTMRFGFTPFNASPVVIEFDVRGFARPLESVTNTCRSVPKRAAATTTRR